MTDLHSRFRSCCAALAALACALLVSTCASTSIDVDYSYDASVDFTKVRTWDWLPGEQPEIRDPRIVDSIVNARMRRAIANELSSRQLKKVDKAIPDVWVRYRIWVMPREDFNPLRRTDSPREVYETPKRDPVDDVGLRIEMFDGFERERRVWQAEGRAQLNLQASDGGREKRTAAAVRKLLSRFPPQ